MTDPAGQLQIRVAPNRIEIRSTRPVRAASLFVGRSVEETARLLPALFGVCATAQSAACAEALEQGLGLARGGEIEALRHRLVAAETIREHLWRILLDWPTLGGEAPDREAMARATALHGALRSALAQEGTPFRLGAAAQPHAAPADPMAEKRICADRAALIAERVLGADPADWRSDVRDLSTLADWSARTDTAAARLIRRLLDADLADLGRSTVAALPALDDEALGERLAGPGGDAFIAQPDWDGKPRDASPLARRLDRPLTQDLCARLGNGLVPRLAAQLLELAELAEEPGRSAQARRAWPPCDAPKPGRGLAQVQAARGLLVHCVRIESGRVSDYRILAPTEWSFHPRGAVALGLADLAARTSPAERAALARLFVAAVDPCVRYELELTGWPEPPLSSTDP